jgi:DNA invertase Pin-like site-specific DNA recombinase
MSAKIGSEQLARRAVVYIRQSTPTQVMENLESQRRQYDLVARARELGFQNVGVIDSDLGRSGSGLVERPGFQKLVAEICAGDIGAVLCIEASRLARNGRDWHHLVDFCALVGTVIIDPEGIYDPRVPNDRLLLGLKGTMSEFELSMFRQRSFEAIRNKAKRGELHVSLPIGFRWTEDSTIVLDPDQRVRESIEFVFRKYRALGSVRQLLMWMRDRKISVPATAGHNGAIVWKLPVYNSLHHIITNPCYAGAYAYGKTGGRTRLVDGRARKTIGHQKPMEQWAVLIRDHHPGYIPWEQYERNQRTLTDNAHMIRGRARAARGGRGLLGSLLRCGRCGRMMQVAYQGPTSNVVRYSCRGANINHGQPMCLAFGGLRADEAVTQSMLEALGPRAVDAALEASRRASHERADQERALSLELEQARYQARLASRRYEAVDADNRLVVAELEARWNAALNRVRELESTLDELKRPDPDAPIVDRDALLSLAKDLPRVWNSPEAEMRLKQRIVRVLVEEIIADVDDAKREIVLVLHWIGGRHTEVRVRKFRTGESKRATEEQAIEVVRRMATRWPDDEVAATLNRLGFRTGPGNTWNAQRVYAVRYRLHLPSVSVAERTGASRGTLTLGEAARSLGVHDSRVRRMIREGLITATQVVPCAPYEISPQELEREDVKRAARSTQIAGREKRQRAANRATLPLPGFARR